MKINSASRRETLFSNILWRRKPFKSQRALQWFSFAWGVYFIFLYNLRGFFLPLNSNIEVLKIILLSIFNHEKQQLPYVFD